MKLKNFRTSFTFRLISIYLAFSLIFPPGTIYHAYALTGGPSQPEFSSFTPIGTSDMVDLSSGDFNYNIPLMDVGGYPINLAYHSGISMDQEASWVGLGWDLSVGQINRNVRGLPDDFDGDKMVYENSMRPNVTFGVNFGIKPSFLGTNESGSAAGTTPPKPSPPPGTDVTIQNSSQSTANLPQLNFAIAIEYNNYQGITFKPSIGASFALNDNVNVGMNLSTSVDSGPMISPNISFNQKVNSDEKILISNSVGTSIDSRNGLSSLSLSKSLNGNIDQEKKDYSDGYSYGGNILFNDIHLTPSKKVGMKNVSFNFNAAVGTTLFGTNVQLKLTGYGNVQKIKDSEKTKYVKAFGYENTEKNESTPDGVFDYLREKDVTITKNTTILPITNYTYDQYSIHGQGVGGSFRPYRSQIGYVNDTKVVDDGFGATLGLEFESGNIVAGGTDIRFNFINSSTGVWSNNNYAIDKFKFKNGSNPKYEKVFYKNPGELNVDTENLEMFNSNLGNNNPISFKVTGDTKYKRTLSPNYFSTSNTGSEIQLTSLNDYMRTKRLLRNQVITKLDKQEVLQTNDKFIKNNSYAKEHHTIGYKVLNDDGSTYVYGKSLYNTLKKEVTFAVNSNANFNLSTGLIEYGETDASTNNNTNSLDQFFNSVSTPAYAHSYLLTSILSSDYEDIDNNGPSVNDLGSYTIFNYDDSYLYKWRVPFAKNMASGNEGFYSINKDQKGNYIYGEREQNYIKSIETKTHIAIFYTSDRHDAYGVNSELGGIGTESVSKKLDRISLFSKKDYEMNGLNATPIKTAYFEYSYDLCQSIDNNNMGEGKLTLTKVYFTYKNSNMGKYTPYKFNYGQIDSNGDGMYNSDEVVLENNPGYNLKGYDIWGNYKENPLADQSILSNNLPNRPPTNSEFPYTIQENKADADRRASAWTLTSIELPSGGKMDVIYESDDYEFVQNKRAMQLFEVVGAGNSDEPTLENLNSISNLYNSNEDKKYLYVKIPNGPFNEDDFIQGIENEPIYFNFMLNMADDKYDFVSGYFKISQPDEVLIKDLGDFKVLLIPMKFHKIDGLIGGNKDVNPISKAGWYYGRQNLNRISYSNTGEFETDNVLVAMKEMVGSIGEIINIFSGPNRALRHKERSKKFISNKSWIRLLNPNHNKFGGGVRVKRLQMHDNWDVMIDKNNPEAIYKQFYGQEYDYKDLDGTSSGVATFEPNGSMENPFVLPFYDKSPQGINSKMLAPKEMNYVEKPIGESFFPSPTITYGRVVVSNISREGLTKHATGKVVNEFYTSYDFPTITKQSLISIKQDKKNAFSQILNIKVRNHITAAQGFVVETNDMNGKPKSQWVYAEGQPQPISGVEYKYFTDSYGKLINEMDVVDNDGNVSKKNIGLTNDIINDFRQSKSSTTIMGINANVSSFFAFVGVLVIPLLLPTGAYHEDQLRMSTTTKIVHRQGILKETIAYDLGSHVSTQNLAFDSDTGQVIVTKTHNEYDQYYYSINYPAHWYDGYKTMGSASNNIDLEGTLSSNEELTYFSLGEASPTNQYLTLGDEINTFLEDGSYYKKLWVVHFDETNPDKVKLMDREGRIVNDCPENETINRLKFKVVRSGFRNVQSAMMASIVTQSNPFVNNKLRDFTFDPLINISQNPKIINASAIEYSDYWKSQCENNLPNFQERPGMFNEETNELDESIFYNLIENYNINPFLFNIRGDWRAKKSYAFLTGRSQSINLQGSPTTSIDGFLTSFNPFYRFENNVWSINRQNWTNASTVTQFSPYGAELENKDALNRYSSAQYGFGYSLPTAVASNTAYKQLGFESFEDIENGSNEYKNSHFSFQDPLVNNSMTALISEKESHTGKKSVMVKPGKSLTYINKFSNCVPVVIDDCVSDIITQPSNSLNIVYSEISSECFYSNSSGATITGGTPNKPLMFHLQYGADHPCAIVTCNVSINGIDFTYQNSNSNVNIPFTLDSEGEAQILVQITEAYCSYAGTNGIEEIRINVDYQIENEDYKQFTYCFNSDH